MAHKSIIETKGLTSLLGNTSDDKVAELAGLHPESVRAYRVRRRIPARWMGETAVGETSIRPLRAAAQAPAPAPTPAPTPAAVAPVAPAQEPQPAARKYRTSAIVSAEDCDGRTTTNEGNAQNIITVYTPTQTARTKTKARVTLSIQHGEDSVLTLKGTAVHTLFRVLSAHYGRPLPRNGWDE
jgi:hypothetical protein